MTLKPKLTMTTLKEEAKTFCIIVSKQKIPELYGVTDGKAVGTFIEHLFQAHLDKKYGR